MVTMSMQRNDKDSDGKLSAAEIGEMDSRMQGMVKAADANQDGDVTKAELTTAIKQRFSGGGAR
jgi:Ca2+-binding EF-hand superfamily protein